ncbi:MAG: hypothetical protein WAT09_15430 [Paracoccaceae bacterium]
MRNQIRSHGRLLFAGLASFVLMGFVQALIGPALPEMTRLFVLPDGRAVILVSAAWVGSATGVALMFTYGPRATPRQALTLLTLGAAVLALQTSWWAMLVGAVVFGTGYGIATAIFNPRFLVAFGARGASMLSLLNAAFAAGAIVAPLVFVAVGGVSAIAFGMAAVLCVVVWILAGEAEAAPEVARSQPRPGFRIHWPIMAFGAIGVGIEASLIGLGPTALISTEVSETHAAQLLSAFFVVFLAARIVLGVMAHRLPSFAIYSAAMIWAALSALVAALWAPGAGFVALGVSCGMFFPAFYVTAARKMGEDPRVTPVILSAGLFGGIGLPLVLAALTAELDGLGFFWLLAGLAIPAALAALAMLRGMAR